MIHARGFGENKQDSHSSPFNISCGEEGSSDTLAGINNGDRPLFVQFCANDPGHLLAAAKKVEAHCDAVDINFGCPQGIAKRGHYGAFLQDDWDLVKNLIGILHQHLSIPVTAKFRIFPDKERTIAYAKMMEAAGAQILTCHGRTREMKGQLSGLADWNVIKAVKEAVNIPVFANGNIIYREDVDRCLELTGCDGVMIAEGNLSNPAISLPPEHAHPPIVTLAHRYLDIVGALRTPTALSAIRAHLFRLLKPILNLDEGLRDMVASCKNEDDFRNVVKEAEKRFVVDSSWQLSPIDPKTGYRSLPPFIAQPYIRNQLDEVKEEKINTVTPCVHTDPSPCGGTAAIRCPIRACLIHCREIRAVAGGVTLDEVSKLSITCGLKGWGCEAHEAKAEARVQRSSEKRKARAEAKRLHKLRKLEAA